MNEKGRGGLQALSREAETVNLGEQNSFHYTCHNLSNGRKEELSLFFVPLRDGVPITIQKLLGRQVLAECSIMDASS